MWWILCTFLQLFKNIEQFKSTLAPKTIVNWENVKKSVPFIKTIMSNNVNFDKEMFFKQFKIVEKNDEWHCQELKNKWIYIFKIFTDNNQCIFWAIKSCWI